MIQKIRDRFAFGDLNVFRVQAANELEALHALSLEPNKGSIFVWLSDFMEWKGRDQLARWLNARKWATVVVLFTSAAQNPSTKNDFIQTIISKGYFVVCREASHEKMIKFVSERYALPKPLAEAIVSHTGTDLFRVQTVVRKLYYLSDGKMPSIDLIPLVSMGVVSTFQMVADQILLGDVAVFSVVGSVASPSFLLYLRRRALTYLKLRPYVDSYEKHALISAKLNIPVFVVSSMLQKAKRMNASRLIALISACERMEKDVVCSGYPRRGDPKTFSVSSFQSVAKTYFTPLFRGFQRRWLIYFLHSGD